MLDNKTSVQKTARVYKPFSERTAGKFKPVEREAQRVTSVPRALRQELQIEKEATLHRE